MKKLKENLAHGSIFSRTLSGRKYTYFNGRWGGKRKNTSISKDAEHRIRLEMAYGAYIEELLCTCRQNYRVLLALRENLRKPPPPTALARQYLKGAAKDSGEAGFSYLLTDGREYFPQELIHRSRCGVFVRSKTELVIADLLYRREVRFHYEKRPDFPGMKFLPDFTIYRSSGEILYWEHCGLMDQPRYQENWRWKLESYSYHGIWPGLNLICTYEEAGKGVDMKQLEELLRFWRLGSEKEEETS